MRNCLFVVLLAGLISACTSSGKPDNIVVTFDVKNPTATEVASPRGLGRDVRPVARSGPRPRRLRERTSLYRGHLHHVRQDVRPAQHARHPAR